MLTYRTEIDGLRAIAVLGVIFYHAGFLHLVPGGYVGVDIFFVISGYLITSLIESEIKRKTFSLRHFYERRCRRILPALFFVLFINSIVAYCYMLSYQLKQFGESLIAVIFFSSNVLFWWKDDGYFARLTELNPLVHTWSLAVEEQFYILFPLCYYIFSQNRFQLRYFFIGVGLISFFLAQLGGHLRTSHSSTEFSLFSQHPWATFYLPIGRLWELLMGTFVALYIQSNTPSKTSYRKSSEVFSIIGLMLILFAIVFLDHRVIPPFPNVFTLIPTFGTLLILLFGTKDTSTGRFLSLPLLRWIGLISYSAYLWHQPLLVFLRLRSTTTLSTSNIICALIVVFLLAIFSYHFIETPFRNRNSFTQKQTFRMAFSIALILFLMALILIRIGNLRTSDINEDENSYVAKSMRKTREQNQTFSNRSSNKTRKFLLIGDSFAQDFYNMIFENEYLTNDEIRLHLIHTKCQLQINLDDRFHSIVEQHQQKCIDMKDMINIVPLIRQAKIIIMAIHWDLTSAKRLPSIIRLLKIRKDQRLFIVGAKNFGRINPNVYFDKTETDRIHQRQSPDREALQVNQILEKTIDSSMFINMQQLICDESNNTCPLFTPNGKLISYDGTHLTRDGARHVGKILFSHSPLNHLLIVSNEKKI